MLIILHKAGINFKAFLEFHPSAMRVVVHSARDVCTDGSELP